MDHSYGIRLWSNDADAFLDLEGLHVVEVGRSDPVRIVVKVETADRITGCCQCGAQAESHDWRRVPIHNIPAHGSSEVLTSKKRVYRWRDMHGLLATFPEEHDRIGPGESSPCGPSTGPTSN